MTESKEIIEKAWQTVGDLCMGKQDWVMSIPVDKERDPDVIIADALKLSEELQETADRRLGLLRRYEWIPQFRDHASQFHFCPECRQIRQDGHAVGCEMDKELKDE